MHTKVLTGVVITALALSLVGCDSDNKSGKSKKRKKDRADVSEIDSSTPQTLVIPPPPCEAGSTAEYAEGSTRVDLDGPTATTVSKTEEFGKAELSYGGSCDLLELHFNGIEQVQAGNVNNDEPTAAECETAANRNTAQSSNLAQKGNPVCVVTGEGAVLVLTVAKTGEPRNGKGGPTVTLEIREPV